MIRCQFGFPYLEVKLKMAVLYMYFCLFSGGENRGPDGPIRDNWSATVQVIQVVSGHSLSTQIYHGWSGMGCTFHNPAFNYFKWKKNCIEVFLVSYKSG